MLGGPVLVNPDFVVTVRADFEHDRQLMIIAQEGIIVSDTFEDIVRKFNEAGH
jgi:hypothetical protein